ncbi:MAG: hypothetical protein WC052_05215 [Patescibacteria group bacterium]
MIKGLPAQLQGPLDAERDNWEPDTNVKIFGIYSDGALVFAYFIIKEPNMIFCFNGEHFMMNLESILLGLVHYSNNKDELPENLIKLREYQLEQ